VTEKCRGVIVSQCSNEIVARPFEKFHNTPRFAAPSGIIYGAIGSDKHEGFHMTAEEPVIWEKMDGFMCTLYTWEGVNYIASKGSFYSTHAKWATAQFRKKWGTTMPFLPKGWTAVFEGICPDLRIVVNYGDRSELVLLAVINNETGEEYPPEQLKHFASATNYETPVYNNLTLEEARKISMSEEAGLEEGYVLTWYRSGTTPFRLKMKFIEYLRLHRLVTNVSPKHIWEVLSNGLTGEMDEYINNSTPWFKKFAEKWIRALKGEYVRLATQATTRFSVIKETVRVKVGQRPYENMGEERKAWALEIMRPENKEFSSILFAMLDGKNVVPIIWKQVKPMTKDRTPMVNGFAY
jgi:RNA ligase